LAGVFREHFQLDDNLEVETIQYCDDALALLRHRPFDLVLVLSLRVPWRTWPSLSSPARRKHIGSESAILFLKQLRALHSQVPVILASASPYAEAESLRNGAFAFIQKPFLLEELDRLVATAFAKDQSPTASEHES
jgi:DNA-binding NtrC family response regulator